MTQLEDFDEAIALIASYAKDTAIDSEEAYDTAAACLADTIGCGILALRFPECTKLLGPVVEGTTVPHGCRVPGTNFVLDPIQGAFNIGTMVRWLDYNDTWLAAEWGHPSDNLGGILAVADHLSRKRAAAGEAPLTVHALLTAMIKAHEIQGGLALLNSFNRVGFDHVILVKVATAAVVTAMLGGSDVQVANAVSNAFVDAGPLRTYRHAPNTGSRKSWAAGDQTSRGVMLALMAMKGEMGYPLALSAERWGLYDVLFGGEAFSFQRPFESYVMENVLFKISYPAEFHAQTAVECAIALHPQIADRLDEIDAIEIETHESAVRIIDKKGPLNNPADRDHCLQYMVAVGLLYGTLTADHYEDAVAKDPRIDALREKMVVTENPQYSIDYLDPDKRSIANAITVSFYDAPPTERIEVEYPLGHRRRRSEGIPLLYQKFRHNMLTHFDEKHVNVLEGLFQDRKALEEIPVNDFVDLISG